MKRKENQNEHSNYILAKEFTLTDTRLKHTVDLSIYEDIIVSVICSILGDVNVVVNNDSFIIYQEVKTDDCRRLGTSLACKSEFQELRSNRPILFVGSTLSDGKRKYTLANLQYRQTIDLREYRQVILKCCKAVKKQAKVKVHKNDYVIDGISAGEAREIGKNMGRTVLKQFAQNRTLLFEGNTIQVPID